MNATDELSVLQTCRELKEKIEGGNLVYEVLENVDRDGRSTWYIAIGNGPDDDNPFIIVDAG